MSLYCLEMRSTQQWSDVRYRQYTRSLARACKFELVPKIQFTDSGHGIVPVVTEHLRMHPRQRTISILSDYVQKHMKVLRKRGEKACL